MFKARSKEKYIVPAVLLMIAVIFFFSVFTYIRFLSFSRYLINEKFVSNVNSLDYHLSEFSNNSHMAAVSMAANNEAIKAISEKNTEAVIQLFTSACDTYRINYFTVTDENGLVLGRTHDPGNFGDPVTGQRNIIDALNGKTSTYFEEGTVVKVSVRTGAPVYRDGELVGVISAGVRFDTDEMVDSLKHLLNSEVTVFFDDIRIATTIMNDGHRIKDTRLDPHIAGILIDEKREYNGEAWILDHRYETHYRPLLNADNKTFAIIFTGIPIGDLATESFIFIVALITIGVIGIALSLILLHSLRKAMSASRTKSLFLANMSHEMRTPINAIIGMTNVAEAAKDPESRSEAIGKLKAAATHLAGLVDDILDISKTETYKLKLEFNAFNLKGLLVQSTGIVSSRISEKQQELSVVVDPDIPDILMGDSNRLMQVIMNLLGNAIKFTPDGGKIMVDVKLLTEELGIYTIQFKVTDMGIGIQKEQQARLFDMFTQADSGSTKKYGGIGLGLAISSRIVEMMGGEINVESELGEGSVFTFTIKVTAARQDEGIIETGAAEAIAKTEEPPCFKDRYILLAEDVEINREIIIAILEPTMIKVECACNGLEAVQMITENPGKYELIFMDIQMPEMDGYDAASSIRKLDIPNAGTIPIIALSANTFKEDVDASIKAGMNEHIGKPVNIDEVFGILKRYLISDG